MTARGPGRPTGGGDRRADILAAARAEFAANGFDRATIRGIARSAGVDAALVHHYFGTKQEIFAAAVEFPFDIATGLQTVFGGAPDGIGERMVRFFLGVWENPDSRRPVLAVLRSAMSQEQAAAMLREFVTAALLTPGAASLDVPTEEGRLRMELAVSQLMGVAVLRYVIGVQPLASTSVEELVTRLAPVVQAHFDGGCKGVANG